MLDLSSLDDPDAGPDIDDLYDDIPPNLVGDDPFEEPPVEQQTCCKPLGGPAGLGQARDRLAPSHTVPGGAQKGPLPGLKQKDEIGVELAPPSQRRRGKRIRQEGHADGIRKRHQLECHPGEDQANGSRGDVPTGAQIAGVGH